MRLIITTILFYLLITQTAMNKTIACPKQEPKLIPREVLFGNPVRTSPQISPDGKKLAYLAPSPQVLNVWIKTIEKDDDTPVTHDTDRGIRHYFWAQNNNYILYLQDKGGNENWRLFGVNLTTKEIKDFTPFENVQTRIIDYNKHFPDDMIIGLNKDDPKLHDAYQLKISTGILSLIAKNPGNVTDWVTDANLKVKAAFSSNANGGFDLLLRQEQTDKWNPIISWDLEDSASSGPVSFSKDNKFLYILDSRKKDASRLIKMEINSQKLQIIAQDEHYDVDNIMIHPDSLVIQAVSFTKERTEWKILDQSIKKDFAILGKLQKGEFSILSRNNADNLWVIGFTQDCGPVAFYLYNRLLKKAHFLFFHKPDLNEYTLANMEPIKIKARDGLTLHGYITYPPGKSKTNLPAVLNVHGGPWVRDEWGYDPEAQWFANRGYVCVQINYRGSSGYGKKFLNAGNKEWGGKMHHDLVDTVGWLIKRKIADPKKIAIYGGSYGGYASLVGATFTPDLFACAIDLVGPSNLVTFINTIPPYWSTALEMFYKRVGNPETEKAFLESRSPLFKIENITIPLLIAQGANDPRVKQNESEQIVQALKNKGIEYEYMLFPDEGHGFAKPQNRIKFYTAAEKFLAKHLNGRYEE